MMGLGVVGAQAPVRAGADQEMHRLPRPLTADLATSRPQPRQNEEAT